MCAIVGAVVHIDKQIDSNEANRILNVISSRSLARGRDGFGYSVLEDGAMWDPIAYDHRDASRQTDWAPVEHFTRFMREYMPADGVVIGNMRAEPTTEFVRDKQRHDQQPYRQGNWAIAHNGTIANDKKLRNYTHPTAIDSAAIVEKLDVLDRTQMTPTRQFAEMVKQLQGSYAILASYEHTPDQIYVAANYRPVWYARNAQGTFFASSRDYFPDDLTPVMLEPYSVWVFTARGAIRLDTVTVPPLRDRRALVVCSGGMDSVVAAMWAIRNGYHVELVHFTYGSRAQGPERNAIQSVAARLRVNLHFLPMAIYDPEDSPLLQADSTIAGGEAGAEFAHEWVPARNLVMLALATAYAEAKGFEYLILGNNLEEAGAYPDNEPEFIARFNDLLPFAIGDGRKLQVLMPVGNMMKHEIVALGLDLGAPLDLTWSCYRAGELHCGTCGPCFMRRTAFGINNVADVIRYANEGE
jgi:7-cyano-7-deazaguanine synthase